MTHTKIFLQQAAAIASSIDVAVVERIADGLAALRERQGRLFLLGVGGSAAKCSHAVIRVETTPSNDLRSYHVSSKKIAERLGFVPRRSIEDAVRDLCRAFQAGKLPNSLTDDQYFNVKTVKKLELK